MDEEEGLNRDQEVVFEQEEEILEPDDGERLSCILQRFIIAPRGDTYHQQRHSLFKTKCTI